ncbi:MAG: DUF3298 domain-containing protein [Chloroflexota bacterium]
MSLARKCLASLAVLAAAFDAGAASFDCAKAMRPQEILVCSDPVLSRLDEQMAASYRAARTVLSKPARKTLLAGQQAWLRYWPRDCSSARKAIVFDAQATACARTRYERRIEALKVDTTFAGKFRVYNVADYAAHWTPAGEDRWFVVVGHVWVYPQIDLGGLGPADARVARAANAWLAPARKTVQVKLSRNAAITSSWTTLRVVSASILGATTEWGFYGDGAVHSMDGYDDRYFDTRRLRSLRPGDFFQGKEWPSLLSALSFEELGKLLGEGRQVNGAGDLIPLVSSIARWTVRREGLGIHFEEYDVACYAEGTPSITIPWGRLADHLTRFARSEFGVPCQE